MPAVIKVENISKAYRLGEIGTGTISHDLNRWWSRVRGKEDPYLKIGEVNDRTVKGTSDVVWSLKDVNFEINQGDAVGIIGRNGAGKSTLLKILSRVTAPTSGTIKAHGRIASLLEVGTGFHPELTGRENIYLNGAILGMKKAEIKRKFDEIVDFSGVDRYIDTPVKRYSSGMYVRLAFAVAAHLESEILIVDEVLAVGDAEFQKKCLGKMGEVSRGEGRTVLFVSHNLGSVAQLCNTGIYMKNGMVEHSGNIDSTLATYINSVSSQNAYTAVKKNDEAYIEELFFTKNDQRHDGAFLYKEEIEISVKIACLQPIRNLTFSVIFKDQIENPVFSSHYSIPNNSAGKVIDLKLKVPGATLLPSVYKIEPVLHVPNIRFVDQLPNLITLSVEDSGSDLSIYANADLGKINVPVTWY